MKRRFFTEMGWLFLVIIVSACSAPWVEDNPGCKDCSVVKYKAYAHSLPAAGGPALSEIDSGDGFYITVSTIFPLTGNETPESAVGSPSSTGCSCGASITSVRLSKGFFVRGQAIDSGVDLVNDGVWGSLKTEYVDRVYFDSILVFSRGRLDVFLDGSKYDGSRYSDTVSLLVN